MNNIYHFSNKDEVYEQASLWIAKMDRGLSPQEERQLTGWLSEHAHNRKAFLELASLWDHMDSLSRLSSLFPPPENKSRPRSTRLWAIAASLFLIVVLSAYLVSMRLGLENIPTWLAWNESELVNRIYNTHVGERSTVSLPDGSRIALNTDTLVKVKYLKDARLFLLQRGEIHIRVAHDASRPLSVIAGNKIVQAVGTAFNVEIVNSREVELIVTDGTVRVAEHEPITSLETVTRTQLLDLSLEVSLGEKIVLGAPGSKINRLNPSEIEENLSWRNGYLVFRGETLENALAEIGRYTEVEFEIVNDDIKQTRIAGVFKTGDIDGLLATLRQNFSIDHELVSDDHIYLKAM